MLAAPTQPPTTSPSARPRPAAADASQPAAGFAILLTGLLPPPATTASGLPATDGDADAIAAAELNAASAPPAGTATAAAPSFALPLPPGLLGGFTVPAPRPTLTVAPAMSGAAIETSAPGSTTGQARSTAAEVVRATMSQPESAQQSQPQSPASAASPVPPLVSELAMPALPGATGPAAPVTDAAASPGAAPNATTLVDALGAPQPTADPAGEPALQQLARLPGRAGSAMSSLLPTGGSAAADPAPPPPEAVGDAPLVGGASGGRPGTTAAAGADPHGPKAPATHPTSAPLPQASAPADPPLEPSAEIATMAPSRSEPAPGAPTHAPHPAGAPAPSAPPVVQMALQIAAAAPRRIERLFVQLEPPALGRVEVRLEFSRDNRVSALIAADRHDILDVLQRDSRGLERALQDAGLRLADNGLSFSLRQEQRQERRGAGPSHPALRIESAAAPAPAEPLQPLRWVGLHRILDIRI